MVSWWFVGGDVVVCRSCLAVLLVSWWFLGGASVVSCVVSRRCLGRISVVSRWCLGGVTVIPW